MFKSRKVIGAVLTAVLIMSVFSPAVYGTEPSQEAGITSSDVKSWSISLQETISLNEKNPNASYKIEGNGLSLEVPYGDFIGGLTDYTGEYPGNADEGLDDELEINLVDSEDDKKTSEDSKTERDEADLQGEDGEREPGEYKAEEIFLKVSAGKLDGTVSSRAVSKYKEQYPQGNLLSDFIQINVELTDKDGQKLDYPIDNLSRRLKLKVSTDSRAGGALAYDDRAGSFSFVPAVTEASAAEVFLSDLKPIAVFKNTISFKDISGHWAEGNILLGAGKVLVTGTGEGRFEPDRSITRAEFVRLVSQVVSLPQPSGDLVGYQDVNSDDWYYASIMGLKGVGILDNFNNRQFLPGQAITREEMADILAGVILYMNLDKTETAIDINSKFTDSGSIDEKYRGGVEAVVRLGVMQGMTATAFEPKGSATRAQAAVVITGMLHKFDLIDAVNYGFDISSLYSSGAVVMSLDTGEDLLVKNADAQIYPASLTKIMTGIVILENWDKIPDTITLESSIFPPLKKAGSSMAGFSEGETVKKEDLLYGAMLKSGGECSHALARAVAGSEAQFAQLMNAKAAELGMTGTNFVNPTGLPDDQHYSTVQDLKKLFVYGLQNQELYTIMTTRYYNTSATNKHSSGLYFENGIFDRFNGSEFTWGVVVGGKTGYTGKAGQCLASLVEKNGRRYIMITSGQGVGSLGIRYSVEDVKTIYSKFVVQ